MIRLKISYKLFGAFFLILATAVGAMILLRHLFSLNFHHYIHQMELEKLKGLVPTLQEEYRANQGWKGVTTNTQYWSDLLNDASDIRMNPPPPPRDDATSKRIPRLLLVDSHLRPLIGRPEKEDEPQLVSIEADGQTVGWLGLKKRQSFRSGPPEALLERQARDTTIILGVVIGLTAFIAFMFSQHLLKPIKQLTKGTRALADRNFAVRITPRTHDELGQLAQNFNEMAQTLEDYEQIRRQWLTDISHELRTPLAVLRAEVEAIQDGIRKPSKQNLASLHMEILRINHLVEDLHTLSITESDSLSIKKETVLPATILAAAIENYRVRMERRQIDLLSDLEKGAGIRIKGDGDRLGQVFSNILENVYKYVNSPGLLKISAHIEHQKLCIDFEDSGPGVPQASLPRLFDRLYRVESSRNRATGGSGLGLSICRHIIENHNGIIWAENSSMGGLLIGIKLPLIDRPN